MAQSVRVKHNLRGYAAVRSAPPVRKMEENLAAKIAARGNRGIKGDGYRVSSRQGGGRAPRWRTTVITATAEAMRDNASNNTLVREFHG